MLKPRKDSVSFFVVLTLLLTCCIRGIVWEAMLMIYLIGCVLLLLEIVPLQVCLLLLLMVGLEVCFLLLLMVGLTH